jgi:glycolate oxidase iron-sulfur subunit
VRRRVTIHDPCDLVRGQGIATGIRQLLAVVPGLEIVEMDYPDRCCGGGGTYSISHPEPAREIGRLKAREIFDTGASLVVTACPGCILQIQRVLAGEGQPLPVLHPGELLAYAYGFGKDLSVPFEVCPCDAACW